MLDWEMSTDAWGKWLAEDDGWMAGYPLVSTKHERAIAILNAKATLLLADRYAEHGRQLVRATVALVVVTLMLVFVTLLLAVRAS